MSLLDPERHTRKHFLFDKHQRKIPKNANSAIIEIHMLKDVYNDTCIQSVLLFNETSMHLHEIMFGQHLASSFCQPGKRQCQVKSLLCVFKCLLKWSTREEAKSHWLHLFVFSPLCAIFTAAKVVLHPSSSSTLTLSGKLRIQQKSKSFATLSNF